MSVFTLQKLANPAGSVKPQYAATAIPNQREGVIERAIFFRHRLSVLYSGAQGSAPRLGGFTLATYFQRVRIGRLPPACASPHADRRRPNPVGVEPNHFYGTFCPRATRVSVLANRKKDAYAARGDARPPKRPTPLEGERPREPNK